MKFLADMGISIQTVRFLRELGHDARHISELHLHRATDAQILERAQEEERIVLTHDLDFGALMAASDAVLPSVVIFRLSSMRSENVNIYLAHILKTYHQELQDGAILSAGDRRIRVRDLPLFIST